MTGVDWALWPGVKLERNITTADQGDELNRDYHNLSSFHSWSSVLPLSPCEYTIALGSQRYADDSRSAERKPSLTLGVPIVSRRQSPIL